MPSYYDDVVELKKCFSFNLSDSTKYTIISHLAGCDEGALGVVRHRVPDPRVGYVNRPEHVTWRRGVDPPQVGRRRLGLVMLGDDGGAGRGQQGEGPEEDSACQERRGRCWRRLHHLTLCNLESDLI